MPALKSQSPLISIFVFVLIGLILGGAVGGYLALRTKKTKEKAETIFQAQKTKEAKEKALGKKKEKKQEEAKAPVEIKEWREYENKEYRYKIKYPKEWFFDGEEGPWLSNFLSDDPKKAEEGVIPGVKVEILVQGNPRRLFLSDWVIEGHQFSGEPKSSRQMKVSGYEAILEELDFEGPTINVTFFRGEDVFTLSYTGRAPKYEAYKNVFEKMVEGMEVEK